jgi:aryl-alcohol dehydrogenase-like predicted oxidoreductase
MKTRPLGQTGVQLTTVGLGTWAIGGGAWSWGWGQQDDDVSVRTILRALDCGVNWIDTAPVYGLGHCETVVGRALREAATRPFVATKCGRVWDDQRKDGSCLREKSIRAECDASLQRLGVEVIDLYQIHWPIPDEEIEEAWHTVTDLVDRGKVRFGGVSNFSVEQLERIRRINPEVASVQPPYSMFNRGIEDELLDYCRGEGIGVLAYSPMQKGLLTGKVTPEWVAALPDDDHRKRDRMFNEPKLSDLLARVDALSGVAGRLGLSMPQLAIAWVLRHPALTAAIVGARRPGQVEDPLGAMEVELGQAAIDEIERILEPA